METVLKSSTDPLDVVRAQMDMQTEVLNKMTASSNAQIEMQREMMGMMANKFTEAIAALASALRK